MIVFVVVANGSPADSNSQRNAKKSRRNFDVISNQPRIPHRFDGNTVHEEDGSDSSTLDAFTTQRKAIDNFTRGHNVTAQNSFAKYNIVTNIALDATQEISNSVYVVKNLFLSCRLGCDC